MEGEGGETKSAEGGAGIGPGPGSRGAREKGGRSASLGVGPGRMKGHSLGCRGPREEQLGMLEPQQECVRHEVPVRYPEETENNSFLEIAIV